MSGVNFYIICTVVRFGINASLVSSSSLTTNAVFLTKTVMPVSLSCISPFLHYTEEGHAGLSCDTFTDEAFVLVL